MNRRDFLAVCGLLGLSACGSATGNARSAPGLDAGPPREGTDTTVLIVGAGVAGMTAAHLLTRQGVDCRVLEAASSYGGRIKQTRDFVDFPIALGAEWLHVDPAVLGIIADDDTVIGRTRLAGYDPAAPSDHFEDGERSVEPIGDTADQKFVGSSWLDFFEVHVVPGIRDRMVFDTAVERIDRTGDLVEVVDARGGRWAAERVIVTVGIQVLADGDIEFVPPLPPRHREALADATIWGGIKVFLAFREAFYGPFLSFADSETAAGQRTYFDAAYGQQTQAHVLGLFAVGAQAEPYRARAHDPDALRDYILAELDAVYAGAASRAYLRHITQDWSAEPYVRAAYLADNAADHIALTLGETVGERIYFAGDAYTREYDWGGVHNAARAARAAVDEMLG